MDERRPHIFVATHHKGGTVWMNTTFRRIGRACGFPFVHLNTGEPAWTIREDKREYMLDEMHAVESGGDRPGIFVDYHSTTPDLSGIERARGFHLVRDPRDMLLSAVRYHLTSDEPWLDEPRREWGGRSFRERLGGYTGLRDRVAFELDTHMGEEITRMAAFSDRADHGSVFVTMKYEELMCDGEMTRFHGLCVFLGMRGMDLVHAQREFWRSSLFGEMRPAQGHRHILDGGLAQWRQQCDDPTLSLMMERLGGTIGRLGYALG